MHNSSMPEYRDEHIPLTYLITFVLMARGYMGTSADQLIAFITASEPRKLRRTKIGRAEAVQYEYCSQKTSSIASVYTAA